MGSRPRIGVSGMVVSGCSPGAGAWRPRLVLPDSARRILEGECRRHGADECCGVLLGRREGDAARVTMARPAANVASRPRVRYRIDPAGLAAAAREARESGLEIVGYYHSHPSGGAEPSAEDLRHAWPETSYLILAGTASERRRRSLASWRLAGDGGSFEPEILEIVDG